MAHPHSGLSLLAAAPLAPARSLSSNHCAPSRVVLIEPCHSAALRTMKDLQAHGLFAKHCQTADEGFEAACIVGPYPSMVVFSERLTPLQRQHGITLIVSFFRNRRLRVPLLVDTHKRDLLGTFTGLA